MSFLRRELTGWLAFALIAAGFLYFASRDITLPGLWCDEAMQASYGMQAALKLPPFDEDWGIHLAGRWLALNNGDVYDLSGFFIVYSAIAFKLGVPGVETLRWAALLIGLGILTGFYALMRLWFSRRAAIIGAILLAVDPVFLIWIRISFFIVEWPDAFFGLCAALCGTLWHKRRSLGALCAAAFILGLSLNASLKAGAVIFGLPLAYLAFAPRSRLPSPREAAAAAVCFLAGAANPILYNLCNGFKTLVSFWRAVNSTAMWGERYWQILGRLPERLSGLLALLSGVAPAESAGPTQGNVAALWVYGAAALVFCWICAVSRPRRLLALAALEILMLLSTFITPSGLKAQHLVVLWPYVILIVIVAADWLYQKDWKTAKAAALCGLCVLVFSDVRFDAAYFRRLETTGGVEFYTDAIYRLADYLDSRKIAAPYALSVEMTDNVYVLTQGRVLPQAAHLWGRKPSEKLMRRYEAMLAEPGARFLVMSSYIPQNFGIIFGYYDTFREAARKAGRKLVIEETVSDRAGNPVFYVFRAEKGR